MAVRRIVRIDEDLCNGCGLCVPSCAEGAIRIVDGKARLVGDSLCDGLGACLGECPQGAISIEEREADQFDESAVQTHVKAGGAVPEGGPTGREISHHQPASGHGRHELHHHGHGGGGCPGAAVREFGTRSASPESNCADSRPSMLGQWPVQLHLLPPTAPFLRGADLVLAADCAAYAFGDFHSRFLRGRALAIACPKLDSGLDEYVEKLTAMIEHGGINTVTVIVMEVPCCNGLVAMASRAISESERKVPLKLVRIGLHGDILEEQWVRL